jgi:type I restriction enzyme R subunit
MSFNEHTLEMTVMNLLTEQGYTYVDGKTLDRRTDDVLLRDVTRDYLLARYAAEGITLSEVERTIGMLEQNLAATDYQTNAAQFRMLVDGFTVPRDDKNALPLFIRMIDFEAANRSDVESRNSFVVVNQFEIKGHEKNRIPDAIVFINGIPVVVFEFKSAIKEKATIEDAYKQLAIRYRRDIPKLFRTNAFVVISDGVSNRFGSLYTPYQHFYGWHKVNHDDDIAQGFNSLETMIRGLFRKDRLLGVIKDFVYIPDTSNSETKIVCRYPQYFAATILYDKLRDCIHSSSNKGGTYWGATGCGKSYAMLFLARMLMRSKDFKSPTIVIITDRSDLDSQISKDFQNAKQFIGDDIVENVESRDDLRAKLANRAGGGVFTTTVQKFTTDTGLLSDRHNIICICDEAHRTQTNVEEKTTLTFKEEKGKPKEVTGVKKSFGFAKYLRDSFPAATFVGFSGTPIDGTIEVFGDVISTYSMRDAVADDITVPITYEGRFAEVVLKEEVLDEIEKYYLRCLEIEGSNPDQVDASKKEMSTLKQIIGDPDRLDALAKDLVEHYETRVAEGASVKGKAMIVCMNREIAHELYKRLIALRPVWAEKSKGTLEENLSAEDRAKLKPIERLKMIMTRDKDDKRELWDMLGTDEDREAWDTEFKNPASNFKIAIVVDMWITGFDVPCLDTMYIDKPLRKHTLIQTISRVNRKYEGKKDGLVVDYFNIQKALIEALRAYKGDTSESRVSGGGSEINTSDAAATVVLDQLDLLQRSFAGFDTSDYFDSTNETDMIRCLQRAREYVLLSEDRKNDFDRQVKKMRSAFNLCTGSARLTKAHRDHIHFYIAVKSVIFKYTQGDAPDTAMMNRYVSRLVDKAISADGVEQIIRFKDGESAVNIFDRKYLEQIDSIELPNTKILLLEKLLKEQIEKYKTVNQIKAVEFSEKLKAIVDKYNDRRIENFSSIIESVKQGLIDLFDEIEEDRNSFEKMGISFEEKAFYDILRKVRDEHSFPYDDDKLIELSKQLKLIVEDKKQYPYWEDRADLVDKLFMDIARLLHNNGYPPETNQEVYQRVLQQAKYYRESAI